VRVRTDPGDLLGERRPPLTALRFSLVAGALGILSPAERWTVLADPDGQAEAAARTFSFRLAPADAGNGAQAERSAGTGLPRRGLSAGFKPGQYALLSFPGRGILSSPRPFSVASSPTEGRFIEIYAKDSGDWSGALKGLVASVRPGARVEAVLRGPFGRFSYLEAPGTGRFVFLAGGIGGAPLLSMARYLAHSDRGQTSLFLWGARTREDLFALDELAEASRLLPRFRFVPVLSHDPRWTGERGRIDAEKLERMVPAFFGSVPGDFEWNSASYRICGPGSFNRDLRAALMRFGARRAAIHEERFSL